MEKSLNKRQKGFSMKKVFFLFVFFLLALPGCMTVGSSFPSHTAWIIKEQTSREDVLMVLGKPYSVGSSNGVPFWSYLFLEYKLGRGTYQKELKLYWTDESFVKRYQFSSSFPDDLLKTYPKQRPSLEKRKKSL